MQLRDYQIKALDDLDAGRAAGHLRQILMMATGSGKTATIAALIRREADRGVRSLFIVDRKELVLQAVRHLEALGLRVGIMQAENTVLADFDDVVVATIQTLQRRRVPDDVRLIVIDEVHVFHEAHAKLIETYSAVPVIGLSATPLRVGLGRYFTNLVKGPAIADLVRGGHLVPTRAFGPALGRVNEAVATVGVRAGEFIEADLSRVMRGKELVGDIISTWQDRAEGRPTLCFAVDIAHSKSIATDFLAAGVVAEHLDAYTDDDERRAIIGRFRSGVTSVLSSVYVLGIGFDAPMASCAILARPTLSLGLHIQQVGRVMRPAPGKVDALVLDHAGNFMRHGRPEQFDVETLDDDEIKRARARRTSEVLRPCPACGFMLEPDRFECPECGHERHRENRVHYRDGDLIEINGAERFRQIVERESFYRELLTLARERGYRPGFAAHKFRERFNEWPPRAWSRLVPLPVSPATLRWVKSRQIAWRKAQQRDGVHA